MSFPMKIPAQVFLNLSWSKCFSKKKDSSLDSIALYKLILCPIFWNFDAHFPK